MFGLEPHEKFGVTTLDKSNFLGIRSLLQVFIRHELCQGHRVP